jgi:hypothetical protein
MEEWEYRAKVAEKRVDRLQNLKELRDSQHRSNIDKLENKVKKLKARKTVGFAAEDKRVMQAKNRASGENLNVSSSVEDGTKNNSKDSYDDESSSKDGVSKAQSESDVEHYIQKQREAFRRPSREEKHSARRGKVSASRGKNMKKMNENFQSKLSASSPKIGRDDLFNAERSRQKRVHESSSSSSEEDERMNELK